MSLFDAEPIASHAAEEIRTDIFPKYSAWIVRKEGGRRVLDHMPWGIPLSMRGKQGQPLAPKPITDIRNLESNFWKSTIAKPGLECLVPITSFAVPKPVEDDEGKPASPCRRARSRPSRGSGAHRSGAMYSRS